MPQKVSFLFIISRQCQLEPDGPELFRDELVDLEVAIDDEAKGGELARTVADDSLALSDLTEK